MHSVYFGDSFAPFDFEQIVGDCVDIEQPVEQPKILMLHCIYYANIKVHWIDDVVRMMWSI